MPDHHSESETKNLRNQNVGRHHVLAVTPTDENGVSGVPNLLAVCHGPEQVRESKPGIFEAMT